MSTDEKTTVDERRKYVSVMNPRYAKASRRPPVCDVEFLVVRDGLRAAQLDAGARS